MQFDMASVWGAASLGDAYWVVGAILWGTLLSQLAFGSRRPHRSLRALPIFLGFVVALAGARSATHFVANLLQVFIANVSNSYSGGPLWVAIPIGAVVLIFRLAQPRGDGCLSLARALTALNCLHAVWALTSFPTELFRAIEPESRPEFETMILAVPALALCGVLAVIAVHISLGDRGNASRRRLWFSSRLQLSIAVCVLLLQMELLDLASFPSVYEFRPSEYSALAIATLFALGLILRMAPERLPSTQLPPG